MKSALLGGALLVVGAVLVVAGVLPLADAVAVGERVWPILLFVVAITIVTELASEAELFRVIAERAARWGLGRSWLLWLLSSCSRSSSRSSFRSTQPLCFLRR